MNAGLYIHIPFCKSKCPYCGFYSNIYNENSARQYVDKLLLEMQKYSGDFDTIYFGGGTPSILPPELLCSLIDAAKKQFNIAPNAEITVECNPSQNLSSSFKTYAYSGVNRVSIGMQSAADKERFALGRSAGKNEIMQAVCSAKAAGITNISLDLMLGTPKQTLRTLNESLDFIEKADVTHVSAYILSIEENTRFFQMKDKLALPDENELCDMYLKTVERLASAGLSQYEISNFAKSGYESRHNSKYWRLEPYLGLGASAHSYLNGKRFFYDENMNIIDDGAGGTDEEKIMLGLRLTEGIDKSLIKADASMLKKMNFLDEKNGKIFLTAKGMLVSNEVISRLI